MINVNFRTSCLYFIAVLCLFSCKKSIEEVYAPPIISNEAIVQKFLQEPANISPVAKGILNDFKKREAQQPFIAEYAKKNGFPRWEYIESTNDKGKAPTNAGTIQSTSVKNSENVINTASIALVPLVDTLTNEVTSYIFCTRIHDSVYAYNTYNKNAVLQQPATTLQKKAQYKTTLSINAFFEKKINNKLSSNFTGVAGEYNFKNIDVKITNTNTFVQNSNSSNSIKGQSTNTITSKSLAMSCYEFVGAVVITNGDVDEYFLVFRQTTCSTLPEVVVYSTIRSGGGGGGGSGGGGFNGSLPNLGTPLFNGWNYGSGTGGNTGGGGNQGGTYYPAGHGPFYEDPNMPLWGSPVSYFNILDEYPELNVMANTANYTDVVEFAQVYKELQNEYNSRLGDPYASMSQSEFLELLRSNPSLAITIDPVTILAKVGAGVAADILMQVMFIKIMDDNVHTWSDAFGKIDWGQVAVTGVTSLIGWNSTTGKVFKALVNGAAASTLDLKNNNFQSWEITGRRFVEGFFGSLVGDALGEIALKFGGVTNFLRRIVNKLDDQFSYATILRWLGGSLGISSPLREAYYGFTDFIVHNGVNVNFTINNVRKIIGWANDPSKVVLIGRNMDIIRKVKNNFHPDAKIFEGNDWISDEAIDKWNDLKKLYPGGIIPYDVVKTSLFYKQNKAFIQKMKEEGYTFIDLGNPIGADPSAFYDMEKLLIFGD